MRAQIRFHSRLSPNKMNSSHFSYIYNVYQKNLLYFRVQQNTLLVYGIVTDVVITFVLYVMMTSSIELLKAFRVLMYCNVVFPALLCNVVCLLFVPYILLPYPVILNLGPIRFSQEVTLLYGTMICWLGALSCLSIAYAVSLNYISVCHFWFLRSTYYVILKWVAFVVPALAITGFNIVLLYLILTDTDSIPSILEADPRNAVFLKDYAALVVYLRSFGVDFCLILLLLIYCFAAIIGNAMIIRVVLRIRARRHEFSAKTYRLHINVVIALVMYCVILFVQLGLPFVLFVVTIILDLSWTTKMPHLQTMMFFPISLFAMSTSIMYLIVIRPFRESAIRLIKRAIRSVALTEFMKIRLRRSPTNSSNFTLSNTSSGREPWLRSSTNHKLAFVA
ncbi:hypothetical protein V3C99_007497 [Haemonchus contortus]|uniref:G protein-coupled receptor n=1 Tax=Haemonchus contortus TaxID=6289 RepID=A0A7I4YPH4_HAECO